MSNVNQYVQALLQTAFLAAALAQPSPPTASRDNTILDESTDGMNTIFICNKTLGAQRLVSTADNPGQISMLIIKSLRCVLAAKYHPIVCIIAPNVCLIYASFSVNTSTAAPYSTGTRVQA